MEQFRENARRPADLGGKLVVSLTVRVAPEQDDLRVAHVGGWRAAVPGGNPGLNGARCCQVGVCEAADSSSVVLRPCGVDGRPLTEPGERTFVIDGCAHCGAVGRVG